MNSMGGGALSEEFTVKRSTAIRTILSFGVAIIILYLLFTRVDLPEAVAVMCTADPQLYVLAAILSMSTLPFRGLRWHLLLRNIGVREPLRGVTEIFLLAWFLNCFIPAKLGDVYRGYLMRKNYAASISRTLGTVYVERVFDVLTLILLLTASSILSFGSNVPWEITSSLQIGAGLVGLLILVMVAFVYGHHRIGIVLPTRLEGILHGFSEGMSDSLVVRTIPIITAYTVVIWALESARLYVVIGSLGAHVAISVVVFVALASALLTALPITPGGLGAVEAAMVGVFLLIGFGEPIAVSVALLDRLVSYWLLVLVGGTAFFLSRMK